jgi:pyrroloquinoline quinone biosynthesis protein D
VPAIVGELEQAFNCGGLRDDVDDFLRAASERGWIV